jgi:hypothetical protein
MWIQPQILCLYGKTQCCGSGITNKAGEKLVVLAFFVAINFKKLKIILLFNKKKSEPFDNEFKFFLPEKIVTKLSEMSGIRDQKKNFQGYRGKKTPVPDSDPQH